MNILNIKMIFILPIIAMFSFISIEPDLNPFCDFLQSEQLDSCEYILNNYLKAKGQVLLPNNEYNKRFLELDTLMIELSKLPCVDTCFYRNGHAVMKTNPPMTDIFIYKINKTDTSKFLLRIIFDQPTKVVWLRKWEY